MLNALPLDDDKRALLAQFIRYGVTGLFVTIVGAGAYWLWVNSLHYPPLVANIAAYIVSMALGYFLHARFSFRGHGSGVHSTVRSGKFLLVSLISFALNSFFVWLLTGPLGGANWWPILTMVFVTPVIVFALNRKWVFA